ncbi:hypothetical protein JTB14_033684 [Gonioctena quinquepunctata]|nr:hypothetical protein JTB14_033684 [Gonioctena quinquepunctata]
MSGEDALVVLITAKLSRHQYDAVRDSAPQIFPSYKTVQAANKLCHPNNIHVTETVASVPLQDLIDHTTQRLIQSIQSVILTLQDAELDQLWLLTKWGLTAPQAIAPTNKHSWT